MLNIYETSVNTDKIQLLRDLTLSSSKNHYILTPNEFKDSITRGILDLTPGKCLLDINVMTIEKFLQERLSHNLRGQKRLDNYTAVLLLSEILVQLKPRLKVFSGVASKISFAENIYDEIRTLRLYNLSPQDLLEEAADQNSKLIASKLQELALIYQEFLSFCEPEFILPEDLYDKFETSDAELLGVEIHIVGYEILVPRRLQFIKSLIKRLGDVNLLLTRTNIDIASQSISDYAVDELIALSKAAGFDYQIIKAKDLPEFNQDRTIQDISQNLYRIGYKSSQAASCKLTIQECSDKSKEAEAASYYIKSLLDSGVKPDEIMIISNDDDELPFAIREIASKISLEYRHKSKHSLSMLDTFTEARKLLEKIINSEEDSELYNVKKSDTYEIFIKRFSDTLKSHSIKVPRLLNAISLALGTTQFNPARFTEYLDYGADKTIKYNEDLNGLTYYSLADIPLREIKHLMLLGVNQSELPRHSRAQKIFNKYELNKMNAIFARRLLRNQQLREMLESSNLLQAIGATTGSLYISYSANDLNGNPRFPSEVIEQIQKIYSDEVVINYKPIAFYEKLYQNEPRDEQAALRAMRRICPENLSKSSIDYIYKRDNRLVFNASKFATYFDCPFKFFVLYGLSPFIPQASGTDNRDVGNIYHLVFKSLAEKAFSMKQNSDFNGAWDIAQSDADEFRQIIKQELDKIFEQVISEYRNGIFKSSEAELSRAKRIKQNLIASSEIVFSQIFCSNISELQCETAFGNGKQIGGFGLKLDSGEAVSFEGQIDRADIFIANGSRYVSVFDYKSSDYRLDFWYASQGYRVQLFIYLLALLEEGFKPAALYYFNNTDNATNCTGAKITGTNYKKLRGYYNEDLDIPEREKMYLNDNFVIGLKRNKASQDEIDEKLKAILVAIKSSLEKLVAGDIAISPLLSPSQILPCANCPCYSICLRNPSHPEQIARYLAPKPK